ncbi:unnamed protein product [Absidia cylindrospora]
MSTHIFILPGLQTLRSQLIEAVKVRVDPTETITRPLVEYVQWCTDCSPIIDLWDYQTNANIQNLECLAPDIVSLFIRLCNTPILRAFGVQLVQSISFFIIIITIITRPFSLTQLGICYS